MKPRHDLFLTGATGAIGVPLVAAIRRCRILRGRLDTADFGCVDDIRVIVHAAAETRFNSARELLWQTNVAGTAKVIEFARACPRLDRLIYLSTTCIAGDREGEIAESPIRDRPRFFNHYEESKWQAEQLVLDSGVKSSILRIATVAGSERDGHIERQGALHHCIDWIRRGLIPMLPGTTESRLDVVSSERVTRAILAAIDCQISQLPQVAHVSRGRNALPLGAVLDELGEVFSEADEAWRRDMRQVPEVVDAATFEAFREAVSLSGDLLFQQISTATEQFLPALLHPKIYQTAAGDRLGGADRNWKELIRRVANRTN